MLCLDKSTYCYIIFTKEAIYVIFFKCYLQFIIFKLFKKNVPGSKFVFIALASFVTFLDILKYTIFLMQDALTYVCKKTAQECDRALDKKKWLVLLFFSFFSYFLLNQE